MKYEHQILPVLPRFLPFSSTVRAKIVFAMAKTQPWVDSRLIIIIIIITRLMTQVKSFTVLTHMPRAGSGWQSRSPRTGDVSLEICSCES